MISFKTMSFSHGVMDCKKKKKGIKFRVFPLILQRETIVLLSAKKAVICLWMEQQCSNTLPLLSCLICAAQGVGSCLNFFFGDVKLMGRGHSEKVNDSHHCIQLSIPV